MEDLEDFLPDGERKNLGIKYYRVTGRGTDLGHKQPYVRAWALEKAASHAANFLLNRQKQVEHLAAAMRRPPIVVSPYDAELYGHWWYEGPQFLDYLFRKMHFDQDVVKPTTPSEYLERFGDLEVCQPPHVHLGRAGLRRGLAQRLQRLDLPAPRTWRRSAWWSCARGTSTRAGSSGGPSTRRRASSCWPSRRTGPSS